ncbi:MAG: hypothetical protein ACK56F_00005, partial [bacterium]
HKSYIDWAKTRPDSLHNHSEVHYGAEEARCVSTSECGGKLESSEEVRANGDEIQSRVPCQAGIAEALEGCVEQ